MIPEGSLRLLGNEGRLARDPAFLWGPVGSGRGSWAISVGGCEGEEGRGAGTGGGAVRVRVCVYMRKNALRHVACTNVHKTHIATATYIRY